MIKTDNNILKKIKFSTNCTGCCFYDDWNGFCKYKSNFVPNTGCRIKSDYLNGCK